jgi:hypothetical protein
MGIVYTKRRDSGLRVMRRLLSLVSPLSGIRKPRPRVFMVQSRSASSGAPAGSAAITMSNNYSEWSHARLIERVTELEAKLSSQTSS